MFRIDYEPEMARLTLDAPGRRNAIPVEEWERLETLVRELERKQLPLLLVEGAGGAFCAGADLQDLAGLRDEEEGPARFRIAMRRALDRLASVDFPTVAWIDGACFGAGVALALACDLRFASSRSRFSVPPAKIGISYPQEDVFRLVTIIGPGRAARLLLTGETIEAADAERMGLVEMIADREGVLDTARTIAVFPRASLAALKRGVRLAAAGRESDGDQDRKFDMLLRSDALAERLALRKRA